jgi:hypothetical protein
MSLGMSLTKTSVMSLTKTSVMSLGMSLTKTLAKTVERITKYLYNFYKYVARGLSQARATYLGSGLAVPFSKVRFAALF